MIIGGILALIGAYNNAPKEESLIHGSAYTAPEWNGNKKGKFYVSFSRKNEGGGICQLSYESAQQEAKKKIKEGWSVAISEDAPIPNWKNGSVPAILVSLEQD
jgi:hypothetical protein